MRSWRKPGTSAAIARFSSSTVAVCSTMMMWCTGGLGGVYALPSGHRRGGSSEPPEGRRRTKTLILRCRSRGSDRCRELNVSKRTATLAHDGHSTVDLVMPTKWSTTTLRLRCACRSQHSAATTSSGRPSASASSTYAFFLTRFRSSWMPSSMYESSSCASCCPNPWNCSACTAMARLSRSGAYVVRAPNQRCFMRSAYSRVSS
mmetsp:Transcript_2359/g.7963  ORF Transcript_2359/g.7963 Transcript_2359/m.7963 type:complete len:204 (-) Transcript_2359:126-737(-)